MDDSAAIRFPGRDGGVFRTVTLLAAFAAVAFTGGCAARPGTGISTMSTTVPATSALVLPGPGTLSIVSVVQRQYTNAIEQQIALSTSAATSGQNFISIQAFGPAETVAMPGGALAFKPVRHSAIQAEIRTYLSGRALSISSNFVRNNYGPFGYAYGRGAGDDGCLYGWQQVRSDEADRNTWDSFGMLQIRLRVCQSGATEKQLVDLMYGYTIVGGFSGTTWDPYGTPASVDAGIGGDRPLKVAIEEPRTAVTLRDETPRRIQTERAVEKKPVVRPAQTAGSADVVIVPSPSGGAAASEGEAVVVPSPVCVTGTTGSATCN